MRGAWIEMPTFGRYYWVKKSLPMRGAWIEIVSALYPALLDSVAPHAGGVDRNDYDELSCSLVEGRSPCGGRG